MITLTTFKFIKNTLQNIIYFFITLHKLCTWKCAIWTLFPFFLIDNTDLTNITGINNTYNSKKKSFLQNWHWIQDFNAAANLMYNIIITRKL